MSAPPDHLPATPAGAITLWVEMILTAIPREYPNQVSVALRSAEDLAPPHELHPAFFGSYDWHSSVHGHWSIARAATVLPDAELTDRCMAQLAASITAETIAGELTYFERRPGFECPYGIAWLLLLQAELERTRLDALAETLLPLSTFAEGSATRYLDRLVQPVRSGQHDQSAFALGLFLDGARMRGREKFARAVSETALRLYEGDRRAPLHFEPSNHDFLSPAFAEADLMRRVLPPERFVRWFEEFLPGFPSQEAGAFDPVDCPDPSHGHLAHRIGLNLSRAWMLDAIRSALGEGAAAAGDLAESDPRLLDLGRRAEAHLRAGCDAIDPGHYAGAHWLGTFAIYALTGGSTPERPALA